jgi:hypothetical protein
MTLSGGWATRPFPFTVVVRGRIRQREVMDSIGGYVATFCVGIVGTYLSQFLVPKVNVRYWQLHNFLFTMPVNLNEPPTSPAQIMLPEHTAPTFKLLTQSLTVQNFGRKPAEWVEIVHRRRPDFFQLYPSLNYTESMTPAGEYVLRVESLAPKNWFTIQFLSYKNKPELLYIRTNAGAASLMPYTVVRKFPQWVIQLVRIDLILGGVVSVYCLIRIAAFLIRLAHR